MEETSSKDNLVECTFEGLLFSDQALTPEQYRTRAKYYQIYESMSRMPTKDILQIRPKIHADIDAKANSLRDPDKAHAFMDLVAAFAFSSAAEREGIEDIESDKIMQEFLARQ